MRHAQGNALFLILIAVALFAALSYAVTQSGRGSGTVTRENSAIAAAQAAQAASMVGQAVSRLRLTSGCTDATISFVYDSNSDGSITVADDYYNASSPADGRCAVFGGNGGGLSFPATPANANQGEKWIISTDRSLNYRGDGGLTSASSELVMLLPNVSLAVCNALNRNLEVASSFWTVPPVDNGFFGNTKFSGSYTADAADNFATAPTWGGTHYTSGICFSGIPNGGTVAQYNFMYILWERQP